MEGWIKLHRKAIESTVFVNPKLWKVFCYCLLRTNHKEAKTIFGGQEITLLPGQFITGRFEGAKDCHMNPSTFRNQLAQLKKMQILDIKSDNKKSLIKVENWAIYQGFETGEDSKKDRERTTKGHRQECKNVRNIYEEDSVEYNISKLLYSAILKNDPDYKEPDIQKWAVHIDRLIRIDNRKPDDIIAVINWTQKNSFWKSNILSTEKLRKQFGQLLIKMKNEHKPDNQESNHSNASLINRTLI